jgi:hypothetical protein
MGTSWAARGEEARRQNNEMTGSLESMETLPFVASWIPKPASAVKTGFSMR